MTAARAQHRRSTPTAEPPGAPPPTASPVGNASEMRRAACALLQRAADDPKLLGLEWNLLKRVVCEIDRTGAPIELTAARMADMLGVPERGARRMIARLRRLGYFAEARTPAPSQPNHGKAA